MRGKAFPVKGVKINFVYKFEFTIFDYLHFLQIAIILLYNFKYIKIHPSTFEYEIFL